MLGRRIGGVWLAGLLAVVALVGGGAALSAASGPRLLPAAWWPEDGLALLVAASATGGGLLAASVVSWRLSLCLWRFVVARCSRCSLPWVPRWSWWVARWWMRWRNVGAWAPVSFSLRPRRALGTDHTPCDRMFHHCSRSALIINMPTQSRSTLKSRELVHQTGVCGGSVVGGMSQGKMLRRFRL